MDLAETLRGYLGKSSAPPPDDLATPLRPMLDPAARTRSVMGSPETQAAVGDSLQDIVRSAAEPFQQVGRAISGRSDNPVPEGLLGALGVATAIPGGMAKGALKAGAKAGGEALEDILKPAAKSATGGVGDMIKAYHGSPHDFERFDLSKIRTGEGVTAYGEGGYFAENEAVAKGYRDALAKKVNSENPDYRRAQDWLDQWSSPQQARSELDNWIKDFRGRGQEGKAREYEAMIPHIDNPNVGKMYEVGIRANPEHFLDWDKPLSEQPHVLQRLPAEFQDQMKDVEAPSGEAVMRRVSRPSFPIRDNPQSPWKASHAKTYEDALAMVGGDKSRVNRMLTPDPQYATQALREAGIPGIKYLDQGSRGKGDGTRNYVVFDDKLIDILKKYGIAGIGALPAMNAYHYQDKQ